MAAWGRNRRKDYRFRGQLGAQVGAAEVRECLGDPTERVQIAHDRVHVLALRHGCIACEVCHVLSACTA